MKKYWSIFKISLEQEFAYKANFVMWRVRNVIQIFLVFFLWDTVFSDPGRQVFGYGRAEILTYVFGLIVVRAFVLSSKTTEVAGEISRGDLSNYLVKPLNYFGYWLTRDISSKALNLIFAFGETLLLFLILRPPIFLQTNPLYLVLFALSLILAMLTYFLLNLLTSEIPFWYPEAAWGAHFLITVVAMEFLSGALFPLDILPLGIQQIMALTPFPYLIYFPIQLYLGKVVVLDAVKGLAISGIWLFILSYLVNYLWKKGLKVYQASGR